MEEKGKIRALIVDDEFFGREAVKTLLENKSDIVIVGEARNGEEAVEMIIGLKPDLLFLDIQMPGLTGLEVLEEIREVHQPVVIFTTAYDEYALKAFENNAIDYLLKPFDQERFDIALKKALIFIGRKDQETIFNKMVNAFTQSRTGENKYLSRILIKETKRIFFVKTKDVYWLEASGDYVILHTENKSHLLSYRLNEIEEKLNPEVFVRVHRSSIVNTDYIQEFEPHFNGEYFITLQNQAKLKLSRTYRDRLKSLFSDLFDS